MRDIIERYLKKIGIRNPDELTPEEKATLEQWTEIFGKEVDINTIANFLETEIARLHGIIKEAVIEGNDRQALNATSRVQNYEAILGIIRQPEAERERLKARLEALMEGKNK